MFQTDLAYSSMKYMYADHLFYLCVVPGAVHLTVTLKGEYSLSVTWEEPKDDGGDKITRYFVKYRKTGSQQYHEVSMGPNDRSAVFEDLTPSTQYIISVRAANSRGNGTSNSTSSTTLDKGKSFVIMHMKGGSLAQRVCQ